MLPSFSSPLPHLPCLTMIDRNSPSEQNASSSDASANVHSQGEDVEFVANFTHRLRFTKDVFHQEPEVLLDLIQASDGQVPRVQFWIDENVATAVPDLKQTVQRFCQQNRDRFQTVGNPQFVPGGEDVKNDVHIIERMLRCFNHAELDRHSYVIVIGGGAVLDAVGFATAIAHRGLRLIRLPTTTLAQADSGLGVKNSINLFQKKNWAGTFAVPWAVINDRRLLETLPARDYVCGFSEAVKVSLLKDPQFFDRIVTNSSGILNREEVSWEIIADSARWHLRHITRGGDPFEMLEARPLDYGHWSAHKLEIMSDFALRHGEAVAIGVAIDTLYSSMVHGLDPATADQVIECLNQLGMLRPNEALESSDELFSGLEEFRQHLGGRLTLTMLTSVGSPIDVHQVDKMAMCEAIDKVIQFIAEKA